MRKQQIFFSSFNLYFFKTINPIGIMKLGMILIFCAILSSCNNVQKKSIEKPMPTKPFPFFMPKEKPNYKLSRAMERLYDNYEGRRPEENGLASCFKYTKVKGFDYHNDDGTITRRDASRIIKANNKYYIWYTKRDTKTCFQGAKKATDVIPSTDWDLADIWYATSKDGFTWEEQGPAVTRPEKPQIGWRAVCTPEILVWKGKYYLYFQAFNTISGTRGDDCPASMAYADSPDGPWTRTNKVIFPCGEEGAWDQYSIHDPFPIVFNGKILLYYKSDFNDDTPKDKYKDLLRAIGVAVGDNPFGPFKRSALNPVINSGHEVGIFRYKDGLAAEVVRDGHEHNTIQFSKDGINFEIASISAMMPKSFGCYDPDAFTDSKNARGVSWGICHNIHCGDSRETRHSILIRFDCDLSQDVDDFYMKDAEIYRTPEEMYKRGLSKSQMKRIKENNTLD